VTLRALVNAQEPVNEVTVLRPFATWATGIDSACVDALKEHRFKPATKGDFKARNHFTSAFAISLAAHQDSAGPSTVHHRLTR
jgi:hypothetical protein